MIERIRTRALWLAVGLVLGGSAFAFAGAGLVGSEHMPAPAVSHQQSGSDEVNANAEDEEPEESEQNEAGEHPENHGKYVSQAAHCEDVNDEANGITFTAPDDCETNGKAHGKYVSSVAKSKAGKAPKDEPNE